MPKAGERVPYRQLPGDFAEVFVRLGVSGCRDHYRAHIRTILRWIDQCGGEALRNTRAVHLERSGRRSAAHRVTNLTRVRRRLMALSRTDNSVD